MSFIHFNNTPLKQCLNPQFIKGCDDFNSASLRNSCTFTGSWGASNCG